MPCTLFVFWFMEYLTIKTGEEGPIFYTCWIPGTLGIASFIFAFLTFWEKTLPLPIILLYLLFGSLAGELSIYLCACIKPPKKFMEGNWYYRNILVGQNFKKMKIAWKSKLITSKNWVELKESQIIIFEASARAAVSKTECADLWWNKSLLHLQSL